jgi:hypothetical protein
MKNFIRNNKVLASILLFMIVYILIQNIKPSLMYKSDGTLRDFGVGYKNKTIIPIWLFSILLGILSYLSVMYYLAF